MTEINNISEIRAGGDDGWRISYTPMYDAWSTSSDTIRSDNLTWTTRGVGSSNITWPDIARAAASYGVGVDDILKALEGLDVQMARTNSPEEEVFIQPTLEELSEMMEE